METPKNPPSGRAPALVPLVAPTISVSSPPSGLAGTTVTLTGTGFTGVTAVTFGGVPAGSYTVVSATRITAVAPSGAGTVQIMVTASGGTSNGIDFTYTIATPVITSVTPAQGPVAGGNSVILTGSGFSGATAVRFGLFPAAFTVVSATQATAIAPASAGPTAVNVTITTPGGTSNGVPYTYLNAPTLTAVSPNQGSSAGGATVTLTGTGFTGATAVTFGGSPAASFTVVSATQITAVPPGGLTGAAPVTVTTPSGTTPGTVYYHYLPAPVLSTATPTAGPTSGATPVVLTGSGLTTTTAVLFGATPATSFTVVSDTQVNAVSPAGSAGTVAVTVTTPAGTSNGLAHTYVSAPTLTSVAPNQGPLSGGTTVTLTGTGLTTTTSVLFGATPATFTVLSDTTLSAVAPAGAAGTVTVTATTPGGTTTGLPYTRVPPPGI